MTRDPGLHGRWRNNPWGEHRHALNQHAESWAPQTRSHGAAEVQTPFQTRPVTLRFLHAESRLLPGLAMWTALLVVRRSRRFGLSLLVLGAWPLRSPVGWSVVTPFIAILALVVGAAAMCLVALDVR